MDHSDADARLSIRPTRGGPIGRCWVLSKMGEG